MKEEIVERFKKNQKVVMVTWLDAHSDPEVSLNEVMVKGSRFYLKERVTFGQILVNDGDGIILLQDIDEDDLCEIVAIPNVWIKNIIECGEVKDNEKKV